MPTLQRRAIAIALFVVVLLGLEFGFEKILPDAAWRQVFMFAMVNVIVALSLNVINGLAGQFSIGHAGFVGIGAYTAAIVSGNLDKKLSIDATWISSVGASLAEKGWSASSVEKVDALLKSFLVIPPALLAAGAVAAVFGFVVGLPSLRLKGDYLAIVTLGFAEIFRLVIATAQTGAGDQGGVAGAIASLGGQNGYAGPDGTGVPQYAGPFWIFGAVIVCTLIAWRLKFSGWGRALRALREDEIASAAVGVDPTAYKVTSFVIAAIGAGIAGGLLASMRDGNPTVQPDQFNFQYSFDAITMVILGGSGSVSGAIVGGLFVTFTVKMIEQLQGIESVQAFKAIHPALDLNALRMVIYAAVLIGLMILRPEGLFGERELFRARKRTVGKPAARDAAPLSKRAPGEVVAVGPTLLELASVSKTFGGLRAVRDVAFKVAKNAVFGLIGPNGAGKTTVFNLITGVYKPDVGGSIKFNGTELGAMLPSQIARAGVARTFQNIRLFGQLTVLENVLVACENRRKSHLGSALFRTRAFYDDEADMTARALELLKVFDLDGMADETSTSLSYGNQRRLEIARAMMLEPKLLLLDEPAAGMNYGEAEGLKKQILWLRDTFDLTVVLVEHNMQVVMGVCEDIHVLDHGETIAHGTPDDVKKHPKVLAAYLGEEAEDEGAAKPAESKEEKAAEPTTTELT
ncbi:MAG TPA: branched-chain amino acid ABC transporter ATP-binding protein/permease [Byssovorax sp.]|jgi:branched-chain amino acid transport system permease protein